MSPRGTYAGIDRYKKVKVSKKKKSRKKNKKRKNKKPLGTRILLVVIISSIIFIAGGLNRFTRDTMKLSDESVIYYINETDKVSRDKLQVNWQEVAAIDLALNKGNEKLDNEDEIKKISESFLKYDEEGNLLGINSFKSVINELRLKPKEKVKAEEYLLKIKNNCLNRDLVKDSSRTKFISDIVGESKENYKEYSILPSITIAQAILESDWGESTLSSEHNNLFGIKADNSWSGKKVNMETKENYEDVIEDYFRAYKNYELSIKDHGKFISENRRYREQGIFDAKTYEGQAQALEDAGYATAKNEEGELIYADLLINVIKSNNLMLHDTEVQR